MVLRLNASLGGAECANCCEACPVAGPQCFGSGPSSWYLKYDGTDWYSCGSAICPDGSGVIFGPGPGEMVWPVPLYNSCNSFCQSLNSVELFIQAYQVWGPKVFETEKGSQWPFYVEGCDGGSGPPANMPWTKTGLWETSLSLPVEECDPVCGDPETCKVSSAAGSLYATVHVNALTFMGSPCREAPNETDCCTPETPCVFLLCSSLVADWGPADCEWSCTGNMTTGEGSYSTSANDCCGDGGQCCGCWTICQDGNDPAAYVDQCTGGGSGALTRCGYSVRDSERGGVIPIEWSVSQDLDYCGEQCCCQGTSCSFSSARTQLAAAPTVMGTADWSFLDDDPASFDLWYDPAQDSCANDPSRFCFGNMNIEWGDTNYLGAPDASGPGFRWYANTTTTGVDTAGGGLLQIWGQFGGAPEQVSYITRVEEVVAYYTDGTTAVLATDAPMHEGLLGLASSWSPDCLFGIASQEFQLSDEVHLRATGGTKIFLIEYKGFAYTDDYVNSSPGCIEQGSTPVSWGSPFIGTPERYTPYVDSSVTMELRVRRAVLNASRATPADPWPAWTVSSNVQVLGREYMTFFTTETGVVGSGGTGGVIYKVLSRLDQFGNPTTDPLLTCAIVIDVFSNLGIDENPVDVAPAPSAI